MPSAKSILPTFLIPAFFALAGVGCDTEGPAEQAGENVDRAVDRAGEAMENAGDKAREQTER